MTTVSGNPVPSARVRLTDSLTRTETLGYSHRERSVDCRYRFRGDPLGAAKRALPGESKVGAVMGLKRKSPGVAERFRSVRLLA
jgi:hypothetical protein